MELGFAEHSRGYYALMIRKCTCSKHTSQIKELRSTLDNNDRHRSPCMRVVELPVIGKKKAFESPGGCDKPVSKATTV
jgi:hypothetical protein